jgi:hypothetical protein
MYPSIPQEKALDMVYQKLIYYDIIIEKTKMTPRDMIELLKICASEVYFGFNHKLYTQIKFEWIFNLRVHSGYIHADH